MILLTDVLSYLSNLLGVPKAGLITGLIFTILVPPIVKYGKLTIKYIYSFTKRDILLGTWTIFHNSIAENEFKPFLQKLEIERGFFNKYKLAILDMDEDKAKTKRDILYTGSLRFEGNDYILNLESTDPQKQIETIHIRVRRTFWDDSQPMHGLYVGVDFMNRLYSTTCMISKRKFSIDYYQNKCKDYYTFDPDKLMIYEERIIKNKTLSKTG